MMRICGTLLIAGAALAVTGCQTLTQNQGTAFAPKQEYVKSVAGFENAGMVDAAQFLGADLMASNLHRVAPQAWNDGYANTYQIETPQHLYVVQGTKRAKARIHEIEATEILRHTSTVGTAGKAVVERTVNLVETPARAFTGLAGRFAKSKTPAGALMVIPSGATEIVGSLAGGLGELGVTGWRITTGAAGTKCAGVSGCVSKASEDIWSGVNSLMGKHAASKEIHAAMGTDPYTDNKVLKRHVDRLAYADAYTSTAIKFGYTLSNVNILDPLATGVGYYNNGEFVAVYEDAHKYRNRDKALMRAWGVQEDDITKLYKSEAFTHITRAQLAKSVASFGDNGYKTRLIHEAASSPTRFIADSRLQVYQYLAELIKAGSVKAFVADLPSAVAYGTDNNLILPFAADYLQWTPEIAPTIQNLAALTKQNLAKQTSAEQSTIAPNGQMRASIHVLGTASPMFKQKAQALGVTVLEIPQTK